ncbi:hypothetical protein Bbelb_376780, partial [Branchiostoma belcheri]
ELLNAARKGDEEKLAQILQDEVDVNYEDPLFPSVYQAPGSGWNRSGKLFSPAAPTTFACYLSIGPISNLPVASRSLPVAYPRETRLDELRNDSKDWRHISAPETVIVYMPYVEGRTGRDLQECSEWGYEGVQSGVKKMSNDEEDAIWLLPPEKRTARVKEDDELPRILAGVNNDLIAAEAKYRKACHSSYTSKSNLKAVSAKSSDGFCQAFGDLLDEVQPNLDSGRAFTLLNLLDRSSGYEYCHEPIAKADLYGVVLPSNIKPGVFVQAAADNNDLNEETLDGKATTHATTLVLFQRGTFGPVSRSQNLGDQSVKRKSLKSSCVTEILDLSGCGKTPAVTNFHNQVWGLIGRQEDASQPWSTWCGHSCECCLQGSLT